MPGTTVCSIICGHFATCCMKNISTQNMKIPTVRNFAEFCGMVFHKYLCNRMSWAHWGFTITMSPVVLEQFKEKDSAKLVNAL